MDEYERERWRGEVDTKLLSLEREFRLMQADVNNAERTVRELELRVQTLATKIAIYASIGAALGGGVMSMIVGLIFKR
jgi:hypothetical protein